MNTLIIVLGLLISVLSSSVKASEEIQRNEIPSDVYSQCEPMLRRAYAFERTIPQMRNDSLIITSHLISKDLRYLEGLKFDPLTKGTTKEIFLPRIIAELKRINDKIQRTSNIYGK